MRARGRTCQQCGDGGRLELHHDDGNPANDDPANLRLLCHDCHVEATEQQRGEQLGLGL